MTQGREVATCTRCRQSTRRCDKANPKCTRCEHAGVQCTYGEDHKDSRFSSNSSSETQDATSTAAPPTPVAQRQGVKRRNRACLSCTRCHRLKVKCDQMQPCSRCCRSGAEVTCTYTHATKPPQQRPEQPCDKSHPTVPFALTGEDPEFVVATWYLRKRGSTHYRAILNRVSVSLLFPAALHAISECNAFELTFRRWSHCLVSTLPLSQSLSSNILRETVLAILHCLVIIRLVAQGQLATHHFNRYRNSYKPHVLTCPFSYPVTSNHSTLRCLSSTKQLSMASWQVFGGIQRPQIPAGLHNASLSWDLGPTQPNTERT